MTNSYPHPVEYDETLNLVIVRESCETTCTCWRHKRDSTEPGLGYCSHCCAACGTLVKGAKCTVSTADPVFPLRETDPQIKHWRDTIRGDQTGEVAA